MSKIFTVKKEELEILDGILTYNGKPVLFKDWIKVCYQFDNLLEDISKADYLFDQPDASPAPSLDGWKKETDHIELMLEDQEEELFEAIKQEEALKRDIIEKMVQKDEVEKVLNTRFKELFNFTAKNELVVIKTDEWSDGFRKEMFELGADELVKWVEAICKQFKRLAAPSVPLTACGFMANKVVVEL